MLFEKEFSEELKAQFAYADEDPEGNARLFFDNSGGSLRLKAAVEAKANIELLPDCPERTHKKALELNDLVQQGTQEIISCVFGAENGALITELTASQTMFHMVELVMENIPGTNAVVSVLEHPSSFDAVAYFCQKTGRYILYYPKNN